MFYWLNDLILHRLKGKTKIDISFRLSEGEKNNLIFENFKFFTTTVLFLTQRDFLPQ